MVIAESSTCGMGGVVLSSVASFGLHPAMQNTNVVHATNKSINAHASINLFFIFSSFV
jgi:hypothetical protein